MPLNKTEVHAKLRNFARLFDYRQQVGRVLEISNPKQTDELVAQAQEEGLDHFEKYFLAELNQRLNDACEAGISISEIHKALEQIKGKSLIILIPKDKKDEYIERTKSGFVNLLYDKAEKRPIEGVEKRLDELEGLYAAKFAELHTAIADPQKDEIKTNVNKNKV